MTAHFCSKVGSSYGLRYRNFGQDKKSVGEPLNGLGDHQDCFSLLLHVDSPFFLVEFFH